MPPSHQPLPPSSLIGESDAMQHLRQLLRRYAGCDAPVLIEGETGTGKELVARELHYASPRRDRPFVPVNCGALPDGLLEAEMFGHRRGAFTDARSNEPGLVEYARGGTLFLDEIDSLSPRAQAILLRFLQSGEFRVVGERPVRTADVRTVAATNCPLAVAIEQERFRRDLFYRLSSLQLTLPPLRERGGDLQLLATHLLVEATARIGMHDCTWTDEALLALSRHDWPGNVRELENVILRACVRAEHPRIGLPELALAEPAIWGTTASTCPDAAGVPDQGGDEGAVLSLADAKQRAIDHFERGYLTQLMARTGGNVSRAAVLAHTERRHLGKLLKRHGIERHRRPAT